MLPSVSNLLFFGGVVTGIITSWITFTFYTVSWHLLNTLFLSFSTLLVYAYIKGAFTDLTNRLNQIKKFAPIVARMIGIDINANSEMFSPYNSHIARISYTRGGKMNQIYLPYTRPKSVMRWKKLKVLLVRRNKEIDITQQPGIPYMVSSMHMGGSKILIKNPQDEVIATYTGTQIPNIYQHL